MEVEVMEGQRTTPYGWTSEAEPLPTPEKYPYVGASIAMSSKHGNISGVSSTLAGYIQVDKKVVGLTNHCVLFGDRPMNAFPTEQEAAAGVSYTILHPAERDLKDRVRDLKRHRRGLVEQQTKREDPSLNTARISLVDRELADLQPWTYDASVLGRVWRSSGLRARSAPGLKCRLDWALIELENPQRFTGPQTFVNEV
jgi:hypothetical protein